MQSPACFSIRCCVQAISAPGLEDGGNHPIPRRPADQKDPIICLQGCDQSAREGSNLETRRT